MVPGPVQAAATVAYSDDTHVAEQRSKYRQRLTFLQSCFDTLGISTVFPEGSFYLWIDSGSQDPWKLVEHLASEVGVLVTPGSFFGSPRHVRVAAVQTLEKLDLIVKRL